MRRLAIAASLGALAVLFAAGLAAGQNEQFEITSTGPLTRIIVSNGLNCQVAYRGDESFELFGEELGSCGTFLALGNTVYGPSFTPASAIPWTPFDQKPVTGSGGSGDPYRIVTSVNIVDQKVLLEQTDTYVAGEQAYRTDIKITNSGPAAQAGVLYRAGDCYLQESDVGFGRVDSGAPACIVDPAISPRIEQWLPITPGSHYMESWYSDVFAWVGTAQEFPNTCLCDTQVDNGAGLSWPVTIAPGQSVTVSHATFFSPFGRGAVSKTFESSVPDPTQISLDPVVVAESVAIAAGVILLVPFPSALFNSTLEENYGEVMGFVGGVSGWFSRLWASIWLMTKRQVNRRRTGTAVAESEPQAAAPSTPQPRARLPAPPAPPAHSGVPSTSRPLPPPPPPPTTDLWRKPQGILLFLLLSALLYAFLDPTFGLSVRSSAEFLGLAAGLGIVLLATGLPLVIYARRRGLILRIRALPATLMVALFCVLISRYTNFQPGYLYGLIVAFLFAGVTMDEEGPARALSAGASLLAALVAWTLLWVLRGSSLAADEFMGMFIATTAVTVVVAGVENAVFGLLPLRFMPGSSVFNWNRRVWLVLLALGVIAFVHVLLNPTAGYLADSTRTSFFTLVALLVGFGLASVLFWAYFRFRPSRAIHDPAAHG
jgi:hypothetical protein